MSEKNNKATIEQVESVISKLENKDFTLYFFTLDTKGNPTASVANIYEHVNDLGYKASILHEKNDYCVFGTEDNYGISDWLGDDYANLPHISIESGTLHISPQDFLIIPEIFSSVMSQREVLQLPCKKVVFSQSQEYIFELLPLGRRWTDYGFKDVITITENQAEYLSDLFPTIKTHVVPVSIPSYFKDSDKPKLPIIGLHTRNQMDTSKITKSFYLQYPIYKWLTFKDLHGLSREKFADELSKCCLSVWVDDSASFGTFPIESIECNTPVIGKVPNVIPEWMVDGEGNFKNNGIWVNSTHDIPHLIANYIKAWLEDSIPSDFTDEIKTSQGLYTSEKQLVKIQEVYSTLVLDRVNEYKKLVETLVEKVD
jgi:hypothetical protein